MGGRRTRTPIHAGRGGRSILRPCAQEGVIQSRCIKLIPAAAQWAIGIGRFWTGIKRTSREWIGTGEAVPATLGSGRSRARRRRRLTRLFRDSRQTFTCLFIVRVEFEDIFQTYLLFFYGVHAGA